MSQDTADHGGLREAINRLATRLLSHAAHGTTDQCENLDELPASVYSDPLRWDREMKAIFHKAPLFLALKAEIPEPGDYKAREIAGVPVLVVRGKDGATRAFLNVCRHRGTQLADHGCGHQSRFTCPYHGWTYGLEGQLIGLPANDKFGAEDLARHGLIQLPCEERAGMVFGVLKPGARLDLEAFYGGLLDDLEAQGLQNWRLFSKREFDGPNWKLAYDGNLENYHFSVAHRDTLAPLVYASSLSAYDYTGPHIRHAAANLSILDLKGVPYEDRWTREGQDFRVTRLLFPNLTISFGFGGVGQVQEVVPGRTVGENKTVLYQIAERVPESPDEIAQQEKMGDFLFDVLKGEDIAMTMRAQSGVRSPVGFDMVFGRNEPANQHFHRWIQRYLDEDGSSSTNAA